MRGSIGVGGLLVLAGLVGAPLGAQELEVGGEVRPRFEVRDPVAGPEPGETSTREFVSMRTRISAGATPAEWIRAFVQVQDVRVWGGELGTTDPSADGLDLHQGWLELGDDGSGALSLRVGRQELAYGGERLVGALNWAQQARSFDGARLRLRPSAGLVLDGIGTWIGDEDAGRPDESLAGLYGALEAVGAVEGYLLFHARDELVGPEEERSEDASRTRTLGVRWSASAGAVDWRVEAAYQSGEIRFRTTDPVGWTDYDDVGAYLVAARFGVRPVDALSVSLWYDRLSGDDDSGDDEYGVFDTLFATNHKFYGHMDLFLDIPRHTARRGLQDGAVKLLYDLGPHGTLGAALHGFRVASAWGLSSGRIGEELDLSYRWSQVDGVSVAAGLSYFLAGAAWSDPAGLGRGDNDQLWGHVMLDVTF